MHVPMPFIAGAAVLFAILVWLALRRGNRRRDLLTPPRFPAHVHRTPDYGASPAPEADLADLTPEGEAEVRALVQARRKIEAIKRLRELKPMSLREAKDWVERM